MLSVEIKEVFGDMFDDIRVEALDCSIGLYADTLCDVKDEVRENEFDLYREDFELIKKYKNQKLKSVFLVLGIGLAMILFTIHQEALKNIFLKKLIAFTNLNI